MTGIKLLKKNPCPDCAFCQYCSETRCSMCLPKNPSKKIRSDRPKNDKPKEHKPLFRKF
ncbi:MAG: hypothetical protein HZB33_11805 [Nitrospirae bacterium]|nr:hypothetical protein [Nitrospirota bacterium]